MKQIHRLAEQLEKFDIAHSERTWVQYTTGIDLGVEESSKRRMAFLKDKKHFAVICKQLDRTLDPVDQRRVEILHNRFRWYHQSAKATKIFAQIDKLETELSDVLNKFRLTLDGKTVDTTQINEILRESPDRELRRRAFQARAQVNQPLVDAGFLRLVELRKEYALACKKSDFVALRLEMDELETTLFDGWAGELRQRKKELRKREMDLAQKLLGVEDLKEWDYGYAKHILCRDNNAKVEMRRFFEPIEKTFAAYGWEIGKLNLTYDVFPRKNKSEWGYNFTIRTGHDSRVLANVNDRFADFNVLMHETAHGVHFLGLDANERLLNLGISGIVAEGFANFFGDLSYSKEFLTQIFGRDCNDKLKSFEDLRRFSAFSAPAHVARTLFDHELYRRDLKSNQDIMDLKRTMLKDMLDLEPSTEDVPWAYLIHHTVVPVYLHNYFLGDVMTANMKKAFKKQFGSEAESSPKRFGRFWRERVLQPSGRYKFAELHENVCGFKLKLGPYLDQCMKVGGLKAPKSVLEDKGQLRQLEL